MFTRLMKNQTELGLLLYTSICFLIRRFCAGDVVVFSAIFIENDSD